MKTYLKINGINGECTDKGHDKWINVMEFHHGIRQESYGNTGGRAAHQTGVANAQEFIITKELDAATPNLNHYCAANKPIDEVTLHLVSTSDGSTKTNYEIKLTKVLISSVQISGSGDASSPVPTETVALRFSKMKWTYTPKNDEESEQGKVEAQWDFKGHS